jgi:hypothetical protein
MANKTKAQRRRRKRGRPEIPDALLPRLALSEAAVTKLIKQAH